MNNGELRNNSFEISKACILRNFSVCDKIRHLRSKRCLVRLSNLFFHHSIITTLKLGINTDQQTKKRGNALKRSLSPYMTVSRKRKFGFEYLKAFQKKTLHSIQLPQNRETIISLIKDLIKTFATIRVHCT